MTHCDLDYLNQCSHEHFFEPFLFVGWWRSFKLSKMMKTIDSFFKSKLQSDPQFETQIEREALVEKHVITGTNFSSTGALICI